MDAFATSMPVSWQIIVWNSKIAVRTLRDFGLIRRVGRQKFAARNNGVDHHWAVVAVHTGT
jgi:hypothetical protein